MKNMEIFEKVAARKITAEEGADLMLSNDDRNNLKTDLSDTLILLVIIAIIASFLR